MKFEKRDWVLFAIWACVLLFTIGYVLGVDSGTNQSSYYGAGQQESNGGIWGLSLDAWTVAFTGILTIVAVIQIVQLGAANEVAKGALSISKESHTLSINGLSETKRSVDAYIDAERGRLYIVDILKYEGNGRIDWVAQNIGAGTAILTGIKIYFRVSGIPQNHSIIGQSSKPILSGNYIITHPDAPDVSQMTGIGIVVPPIILEALNLGNELKIVFHFRYSTMGRIYQTRITASKSITDAFHSWGIIDDPILTNEKMVIQLSSLRQGSQLRRERIKRVT
jgi:hypothetical protein